jgi:hypothetical protein
MGCPNNKIIFLKWYVVGEKVCYIRMILEDYKVVILHSTLTPTIPSVFLTNFCSFWPTWRNPFLYQKKYENLRK